MAAPTVSAATRRKRTYSGPGAFLSDIVFVSKNARALRRARREGLVSPPFQRRLMLAITAVNGCRYCSWFHAREALKSGIGQEELAQLLEGTVDGCPGDEAVALLYAQHWAESNAHPTTDTTRRLEQEYGPERSEAIHMVLRMIRMGNLAGNTWDAFLHLVSFGRLGSV